MAKQSYGISEAARLLGISPEALRQRVRRGAVEADKGTDGRWYVLLDDNATPSSTGHDTDLREFIEEYRAQLEHTRKEVEAWREESKRKDSVIMTLLQRPPAELEAPDEEPPRSRSWWRRLFGLR
jgi:DNA-binding transcriptional MerR regulator